MRLKIAVYESFADLYGIIITYGKYTTPKLKKFIEARELLVIIVDNIVP